MPSLWFHGSNSGFGSALIALAQLLSAGNEDPGLKFAKCPEGTGVGVADGAGVCVGSGVGVATWVPNGAGVEVGEGVEPAPPFCTLTDIDAVPSGVVPPFWNTLTVKLCEPFAMLVEFHVKLPPPESTLLPSIINWSHHTSGPSVTATRIPLPPTV